jgi:hypothetical protein
MRLALPGGQAPGIPGQDFVIETFQPPLALVDSLGLKTTVPIAGDLDGELSRFCVYSLLPFAMTVVPRLTSMPPMGRIPEVLRQFGLQSTLDDPFRQLLQQAMLPKDVLWGDIVFEEFI